MKVDSGIRRVRDGGGGATQVHRNKDLRFVLPWNETTPDHGLYDEDADGG